jgi:N-acetylmuramoyl-L-alanine amidase
MIINVHAGHNPDGKVACGAIGIIRESTEARRVKDAVISGRQGKERRIQYE